MLEPTSTYVSDYECDDDEDDEDNGYAGNGVFRRAASRTSAGKYCMSWMATVAK